MIRILFVSLALMSCGASDAELRTARKATYAAPPKQIFDLALEAARDTYKIAAIDVPSWAFVTQPRWYNPEGGLEGVGAGDAVVARDRSVNVAFIVRVIPTPEGRVTVTVTPKTMQFLTGSPKPRELGPEDPFLPSFVHERADALTHAIFTRAKRFYVAPP